MNEQTVLNKSKKNDIKIDEWEDIVLIAKNRTHPVIYGIFSEFYNEWKLDHVSTVEEEDFDEHFGSEYFISLWQYTKTKHWIIWCSHGLEATIEFDTFWIVFPRKIRNICQIHSTKIQTTFRADLF